VRMNFKDRPKGVQGNPSPRRTDHRGPAFSTHHAPAISSPLSERQPQAYRLQRSGRQYHLCSKLPRSFLPLLNRSHTYRPYLHTFGAGSQRGLTPATHTERCRELPEADADEREQGAAVPDVIEQGVQNSARGGTVAAARAPRPRRLAAATRTAHVQRTARRCTSDSDVAIVVVAACNIAPGKIASARSDTILSETVRTTVLQRPYL